MARPYYYIGVYFVSILVCELLCGRYEYVIFTLSVCQLRHFNGRWTDYGETRKEYVYANDNVEYVM